MSLADGGVQGVEVGVVHGLGDLADDRRRRNLLNGKTFAAQGLDQVVASGLDGVFAPFPREPLPDLVAGPGRDDDLQPVAGRPGVGHLRREDLHGVA